jgi:hypothetical protein
MKKFYSFLLFLFLSINSFAGGDEVKLFSIYPVPLKSSRLFVKLNFIVPVVQKIEIRNLIGKKIQEKEFPIGSDQIYFDEIDANPNGVYIVLAKDANGKVLEISKFILNK